MEFVELPVRLSIGGGPAHEIGTIRANSTRIARSQIAEALREAADVIEAEEEAEHA